MTRTATKPIRVTERAWKKISKLKKLIPGSKREQNIPNFIDGMLETIEMLQDSSPKYITQGKVYEDLAVARGEAIQAAALASADEIDWPTIAIIIGKDEGT
jgi:hypothetical protein